MRRKIRNILYIVFPVVILLAFYFVFPLRVIELAKAISRHHANVLLYEGNTQNHKWPYLMGGKGPTILMLHGFGADKDFFNNILKNLTEEHTVIIPDLPGFGENIPQWDHQYNMDTLTKELHQFILALNLKEFHLFGLSMGGGLAINYTWQYPERITRTIVLSPYGILSGKESRFQEYYKNHDNPMIIENMEDYKKLMKLSRFKKRYIPSHLVEAYIKNYFPHPDFLRNAFDQQISNQGWDAYNEKSLELKPPLLVIWGKNDEIFDPSNLQHFIGVNQDYQTLLLDSCGHLVHLDQPDKTTDAILIFLD